jgi:sugar phosphate permease
MNNGNFFNTADWHKKANLAKRLAWLIWIVAMLAQIMNTMHRVGAAAALDQIMSDFGITAATVGILMSMYFYVYAFMQFPSGILADSLGPRKTITIGCLVATVGSIVFGMAPTVPLLFIGRFLISLGVSVAYVNVIRLTVDWFESKHFAKLVGLNGFMSTLGSIIGTTPMAILITAVGWHFSFEIIGILNFLILIACWFVIRDKPSGMKLPSPLEREFPQELQNVSEQIKQVDDVALQKRLRFVLRSSHVWLSFVIAAGLYGTMLVLVGAWGIPYLMQVYGMSRDAGATLMLVILISHVIGIMAIPVISDRISSRKLPLMVCTITYFIATLALIFINQGKPPAGLLYVIFTLMGFFAGATPLSYVVAKENMPSRVSGNVVGLANVSPFLCAAIFQMLVGLILDARWEGAINAGARIYSSSAFQSAFMLILIPAGAAVLASVLVRETRCRDIGGTL